MWSLLPDAACYSSIKITCEVSLPGATVSLMYAKMLSQVAERRVDCALVSSSTKFVRSDAGRRSSRGKYTLRTCNFMLFTILLICCFIHFTWINSNEQKSIFFNYYYPIYSAINVFSLNMLNFLKFYNERVRTQIYVLHSKSYWLVDFTQKITAKNVAKTSWYAALVRSDSKFYLGLLCALKTLLRRIYDIS